MVKNYIGILRHPGFNGSFADDVLGFDPNGGGIYDIPIIGDVADAVVNSPLGNVVAYAFPISAPFIYGAKAAQSLASGNELGALLNAVGAYSTYASPTATTTATVGGMDIAGVNANLVAGVEMAKAGGASLTDIAKVMVGMGDQAKVAEVLTNAGYDAAEVATAVNNAGQAAMDTTLTATDAQTAIAAMKDAGMDPTFIQSQAQNFVDAGIIGPEYMEALTYSGQTFPIDQRPDAYTFDPDYQGFVNDQGFLTDQVPFGDVSSAATDLNYFGVPTDSTVNWSNQIVTDAGGDAVGFIDGYGNYQSYADIAQQVGTDVTNIAGKTQAQMLADQYSGFTQDEILNHMAGSSIDPVLGEEILTNLGMDPFTVSDYMDKNPTSFGNTYADPSFLSRLKSTLKSVDTLKNLWGGAGTGGTGGSDKAQNYSNLMQQLDPYWNYRKQTEIPLMGAAAGAAGNLSGLYQQSFSNPLASYNTPEMQALNAEFMDQIQRRDAAAGRNSQYGARAVEAQNQYLTKALPAYRTNLQQGLGTLYQAARPQTSSPEIAYSAMKDAAVQGNIVAGQNVGTISGTVGNLQNSWNQMNNSGNVFGKIEGAINTASNLSDLYTQGKDAWKAGSQVWDSFSNLF